MNKSRGLPIIAAIVAMAENRVIGGRNQLLWRLQADFKHFKTITMGHPIIMGRKTYESIGKPLPGRLNIVITRNPQVQAPGCTVVTSVVEAIDYAVNEDSKEIFIIGGEEIFKQSLARIQRIYLTLVHHEFNGDVYFPALNENEWQVLEREDHEADELNPYAYSFLMLEREVSTIHTQR